jgi:glycerate-2-kinase
LAQAVGVAGVAELRELHRDRVEEGLRAERRAREPHWTESLAVGGETFVQRAQEAYAGQRREFVLQQMVADEGEASVHALRETGTPYNADLRAEMAT